MMYRRDFLWVITSPLWLSAKQDSLLSVQLFSQIPDLHQVTLHSPFVLEGETFPHGSWQLQAHQGQLFLRGGGQPRRYRGKVTIQRAFGIQALDRDPRRYRGIIEIRPEGDDQLRLINYLDPESYLLSVVPAEMPSDWPEVALQVQAILARTNAYFALNQRSNQERALALLKDSTQDQAYGGLSYETPATTAAVRSTQGTILQFEGEPLQALFHSTCAGHTSANQFIFAPPARPYLQGVECTWCHESPFYKPQTRYLSLSDLARVFDSYDLEVLTQDPYGRPGKIRVGSRRLSGQDFWLTLGQHLGWGLLPSNRYHLRRTSDGYTVEFRGAGHGVGVCQWGVRGQALAGYSLDRILKYYYPHSSMLKNGSQSV